MVFIFPDNIGHVVQAGGSDGLHNSLDSFKRKQNTKCLRNSVGQAKMGRQNLSRDLLQERSALGYLE